MLWYTTLLITSLTHPLDEKNYTPDYFLHTLFTREIHIITSDTLPDYFLHTPPRRKIHIITLWYTILQITPSTHPLHDKYTSSCCDIKCYTLSCREGSFYYTAVVHRAIRLTDMSTAGQLLLVYVARTEVLKDGNTSIWNPCSNLLYREL